MSGVLAAARLPGLLLVLLAALLLQGSPHVEAAGIITSPEQGGNLYQSTSLVLDSGGRPVIAYYDAGADDLKVMHCNDVDCAGKNESITMPATTGNTGFGPSLALSLAGYPIVSYVDVTNGDLKLLTCNDANCAGSDAINTPDNSGDVLSHDTSLAPYVTPYPVIGYMVESHPFDNPAAALCNDAACSGSNETINSISSFAFFPCCVSIAPGTSGDYTLVYYNDTSNRGYAHQCAGVACSSNTFFADGNMQVRLDSSGYPVVAYERSLDLYVMHCNDAECAGDDEAVNPVYTTENVADLSFTLDSTGNPVISFYTYSTFDLHVVHCNDAACADGDDQAVSADVAGDVGDQSSVAVDGSGNPVVSYVDKTNGAVKVLHCGDANCASSVEVGGIAALSGMDSPTENGSGILVLVFTAVAAAIGLAGVALIGRRRVA